jgi:hypothetical protein
MRSTLIVVLCVLGLSAASCASGPSEFQARLPARQPILTLAPEPVIEAPSAIVGGKGKASMTPYERETVQHPVVVAAASPPPRAPMPRPRPVH